MDEQRFPVEKFTKSYDFKDINAALADSESGKSREASHRLLTAYFEKVSTILFALADDFRTIDWLKEYSFPNSALEEIQELVL